MPCPMSIAVPSGLAAEMRALVCCGGVENVAAHELKLAPRSKTGHVGVIVVGLKYQARIQVRCLQPSWYHSPLRRSFCVGGSGVFSLFALRALPYVCCGSFVAYLLCVFPSGRVTFCTT